MQEVWPYISAMWTTLALLAGGYARTRNRSAFIWFLLTLFFGPIAVFFLVIMDPAQTQHAAETPPVTERRPAD
ncbi:hypothetical protein [Microbacterium sp.]|uniref:hypothetical protein n=1 Tax=Microbacterium sp. TaxID=51671 RepID=UPI003A915B35